MDNEPSNQVKTIAREVIEYLLQSKTEESRVLDYKSEFKLDDRNETEKEEFAADITAFANTSGGQIYYGITEEREDGECTGLPDEAPGIEDFNDKAALEKAIKSIENSLNERVQPRISGLSYSICR